MDREERLRFLLLKENTFIQEMYENYFENRESFGDIKRFIFGYFRLNDEKLLRSAALEEFRESFQSDSTTTVSFLSALGRYLKNDLNLKSDLDNSEYIEYQKILREAVYQSFSIFSCQNQSDLELELMLDYELVVRNKEKKNYSRSLEIVKEMSSKCAHSRSEGRRLFGGKSHLIHPLNTFSGPEVYIQLQYNLIHSKMGNHLSEMKFDSINPDISFSRFSHDGFRIEGPEYERKFQNASELLYQSARQLLYKSLQQWKRNSSSQVFEQFFFLILDVLLRRYHRNENDFVKSSFIGEDIDSFSKIQTLIDRSHLSKNVQDGLPHIEDAKSAKAAKNWISKKYAELHSILTLDNLEAYSDIRILRDSIGDIDENAPLAERKSRRPKVIQYFRNNESSEQKVGRLSLKQKIRFDLSDGMQGKLNRANTYCDAVLLNMMKVGKIQKIQQRDLNGLKELLDPETKIRYESTSLSNDFLILRMLHQKSTGQVIKLSTPEMIRKHSVPKTHFSTHTLGEFEKLEQYRMNEKFSELEPIYHLSTYFARGYNILQFAEKKKSEKNGKAKENHWTITRSTKLDRINVIAKGLSELRNIVSETIDKPSINDTTKGYREDLLASESHPLLIISQKDSGKESEESMSEFDKTVYAIPFIIHRFSEIVNALADLNQYKRNLTIPFPYKRRVPTLINKYSTLVLLELKRLQKFIKLLKNVSFDIDQDWKERYNKSLYNLEQDRKAALYKDSFVDLNDLKFKGKNSAYKPLEIEREFVKKIMNSNHTTVHEPYPVIGYLDAMINTLDRIICDSKVNDLTDTDCISLFEQYFDDVFSLEGKYSPNELIVGTIAGVILARGWSH